MRVPGRQLGSKPRHQARDVLRQQVQRDHGRFPDVGLEQIAPDELHPIGHPFVLGARFRQRDQLGLELDSHSARLEALGGRDHETPVAGTEVVDHVAGTDVGELQHLVDDHPGGGDVGTGVVVLLPGVLPRGGQRGAEHRGGGDAAQEGRHASCTCFKR
ncbi:MAG TPA: hypothetical protein VJO54_10910 [Burkholderiales bacterium]|nr:hypothetical protein [Burkholderiales bacterium]